MRRLERGASYVPLIIVIVLLIVAVVWAWVKTTEAEDLEKRRYELDVQVKDLVEERSETALRHRKILEVVGFGLDSGESEVDPTKVTAFTNGSIDALKKKYLLKAPVAVYNVTDDGGLVREQTEEEVVIEYVAQGSLPSEVTAELLYGYMHSAMGRMLFDLERLIQKLGAQRQNQSAQAQSHQGALADKDTQIQDLTTQLNTAQTQAAEEQQRLKNDADAAEDKARAAVEELAQKKREFSDGIDKKDNEILALSQKVRKLMAREKLKILRPGPDGEVLASTAGSGLVILNRGKKDHLMPGLSFKVYNFGKGGQRVDKGIIHVLDVDDAVCRARITELLSPMKPIVQGDLFESPVYDPDEAVHFYLLGRFRKYGKSDAKVRLETLGAIVDDKVSIDTNYLVIGEPESDEEDNLRESVAYKRAMELGVKVITEQQLAMFLRY